MKSFILCLLLVALTSAKTIRYNNPKENVFLKDTNPIFLNETYYVGFEQLDTRGSLFYWLFESRNDPKTDPLVVWLTGGPGCSSELAVFMENGPFKINKNNNTLRTNPYSWNNNANVLYVDQPLGTGFSTGEQLDSTEGQIAKDFHTFLQEFLKDHPEYEGRDFWITGESYAGHYIPAISTYIFKQGDIKLNFKGLAIGDGLISVYYQYPAYATFSLENNLISQSEYTSLVRGFEICDSLIDKGYTTLAYYECNIEMTRITGNPPRFNVYDIRLPCDGPLCYNMTYIDDFIEQPEVEKALGVTGRPWSECNSSVHTALTNDWMTDLTADFSFLVTSGLQVLQYHGDKDFICNWRGGEQVSNNLNWTGNDEFKGLNYTEFGNYGAFRHLDNFTFFRVYNAGHMVPMDQPEAALAMLTRFIGGWSDASDQVDI